MISKGFKQFLAEANAVIETISVVEAKEMFGREDVVFVDVREGEEWSRGRIAGAAHAPRGFLEFLADPESPMHNAALDPDKRLVLYCATGGRSTLATRTLREMGFERACHIAGGFNAWLEADGPIER
ncbi:MAG: rhodanese-like domain-containing protein [Alphaproteobacteria bacterium]|nr:rhodanese-like domain-containing protein [Alphaproteobacteria bacterium]